MSSAVQPLAGSTTVAISPVPFELYTWRTAPPPVAPPAVGSPAVARAGTTIWFPGGSLSVADLNAIFRRFASIGGVESSFSVSDVDWISTIGSVDVDVLDVVLLLVVVDPSVEELDVDEDVDVELLLELVVEDEVLVVVEWVVLVDDVLGAVLLVVVVVKLVVDVVDGCDVVVVDDVVELVVLLDVLVLVECEVLVDDLVLLVLLLVLLEVELLVVVVEPPHGPVVGATLAGSAGSVPQSSSRRS